MRSSQLISPLLVAATLSAGAPLLLPQEDPSFLPTAALPTSGTVVQSFSMASTPATIVSLVDNSRGPTTPVTTIPAFQSLPATNIPLTESTIIQSVASAAPVIISLPSFAPSQAPTTFVTSLAPPNVATVPAPSANPMTFVTSVTAPVRVSTQVHSGVLSTVSTAAY